VRGTRVDGRHRAGVHPGVHRRVDRHALTHVRPGLDILPGVARRQHARGVTDDERAPRNEARGKGCDHGT
jgi:hypothetical protein